MPRSRWMKAGRTTQRFSRTAIDGCRAARMFQCRSCEHACSFLWLGVKGNPPQARRTDLMNAERRKGKKRSANVSRIPASPTRMQYWILSCVNQVNHVERLIPAAFKKCQAAGSIAFCADEGSTDKTRTRRRF